MPNREYDNSPVYMFLMFVGLVIAVIVAAKLDYEYHKQITKDAMQELQSEQKGETP